MSVEKPKRPVRRGWVMFKFSEAIPRKPAKMKIRNAQNFDCFSFESRKMEMEIRRNAIIF